MAQTPLTTDNPLRSAYDAAWSLLRSKVDFGLLFGESDCLRQITVNDSAYWASDREVDHPSLGAHPRIRIVARQLDPNTERDSTGSQPTMILEIQIWSSAQQQALILDCVWTILRAMLGWREYVRNVVSWNGNGCVVDVDAQRVELARPRDDTTSEASDRMEFHGLSQWIAVWRTKITFSFKSLDMQML